MLNRLRWILLSYVTRPAVLFTAGMGLLVFVMPELPIVRRPELFDFSPRAPQWRLMINSAATLNEVRAAGRQNDVDAIDLGALWSDVGKQTIWDAKQGKEVPALGEPTDEFYQTIREFPNLRGVLLSFFGGQRAVEEIARIPSIEYISLQGVPRPSLQPLRSLARLQRIDFRSIAEPITGLDALSSLPQLETLDFHSPQAVDDSVLEQVAQLPHLQTLVIGPVSNPDNSGAVCDAEAITGAGFDALAKAPALKTLYVGAASPIQPSRLYDLAQSTIADADADGRVTITHAAALHTPPYYRLLQLTAGMWIASAIGLQLATQFSRPAARLTPHFDTSHLIVAAGLACLTMALIAWPLLAQQAALGPTMALSAAMVMVSISNTAMVGIANTALATGAIGQNCVARRRGFARLWRFAPAIGILSLLYVAFSPSVAQPYLSATMPWLTATLIVVAMANAAFIVWSHQHLFDWSPAVEQLPARRLFGSRPAWPPTARWPAGHSKLFARREAQIERFPLHGPRLSYWQRIERWRLGNSPISILVVLGLMIAFLPSLFATVYYLLGAKAGNVEFLAGLVAWGLPGMLVSGVAVIWRARRLTLPLEVNRPVSRRAFQNELAAAFVLDVTPCVALFALLSAVVLNLSAPGGMSVWSVDWSQTPIDALLFFLSILPLAIGLVGLIVVLQRAWLGWSLAYGIGMPLFLCVKFTAIVHAGSTPTAHGLILRQLWIPAILGVGLLSYVFYRWRTMELGQID